MGLVTGAMAPVAFMFLLLIMLKLMPAVPRDPIDGSHIGSLRVLCGRANLPYKIRFIQNILK